MWEKELLLEALSVSGNGFFFRAKPLSRQEVLGLLG